MNEATLQAAAITFLIGLENVQPIWSFHCPSEGKHKPQYRRKMAQQGVRPGVSDIIVLLNRGRSLWIELKAPARYLKDGTPRYNKPSDGQLDFAATCKFLGHHYYLIEAHDKKNCIDQIAGILSAHGEETG